MKRGNRVRKSLIYSYIDGVFASIMVGIRDTFVTPFAIVLGATTGQVGLLTAVPNLLASLAQLKAADAAEVLKSRKRVITISVFIHSLMFLPIFLIPFLIKRGRIEFLIFFYTLHLAFGNFSGPAWGSLISEYIPPNKRGLFFGFRNKVFGFITVASAFAGGLLLERVKRDNIFLGYGLLFFTALTARLISWYYIKKMYEPAFRLNPEARFSFLEFVARIKRSNFTRFVFYVASMTFCVNISAPFFSIYMLRELKMSYTAYTIITIAATITILVMMDRWGKRTDLFGNIKVLRLCSFFVPFVPILWLFSSRTVYLVLVQVFAGFFWSGFNLAASNFIYDAVSPPKRTRCIAYFNVINGTAIFLGATAGGYIARFLPKIFSYRLMSLFLLSGLLRLSVAAFSFSLREVRKVEKTTGFRLLQEMTGLKI